MTKNIKLGLITIGNGNWKKVITSIWNSIEIDENEYYAWRANGEYDYKLKMRNEQLPSTMTNYDLHLKGGYLFKLLISMPVISNHWCNDSIVMLPWIDIEYDYKYASRMCCETIINREWTDNIIILCGDSLSKEELDIRNRVFELCDSNGKSFLEIGNDCECMNLGFIVKWINSGENYGCYMRDGIRRVMSKEVI